MENKAAWIDGVGQRLRVGDAEVPRPGPGEILLRNKAVAVNPIDYKIQDYGMNLDTVPRVLGGDVAGEVIDVGEGVTRFVKGDRVIGRTFGLFSGIAGNGGYQLYSAISAAIAAKIPDSISFAQGSVLPVAFETGLVGLCAPDSKGLGLPLPSLTTQSSGKTVVIWGGSSSVGALAIQLAKAAGMHVVAVASQRNFGLCRTAGATDVFDYNSPTVDDDVVAAVRASGGAFGGVYDTIAVPASLPHTYAIANKLGGGSVAVTLPLEESIAVPENVKVIQVFGYGPMPQPFWTDFVTPALEKGVLKCLPEPWVVGKGLEFVQRGIDESKKGVSAKKVVIEL